MDEKAVLDYLQSMTDKQFIEFFYKHLSNRHLHRLERAYLDCHLVLGAAQRLLNDDGEWEAWDLQLLCPTPNDNWVDDAPVCQFGEHCGHETASWAKQSVCPVCGGDVFGT